MYPREVVEDLRQNTDIVELISAYMPLKQRGGNYVGLCPFHNEKTPSFNVSADRQTFHCFGCGAGGNAYSFVMQIEHCDFPQAIQTLAERINYRLPEKTSSRQSAEEIAKADALRQKIYELNGKAARFFYDSLQSPAGREAAAYLDKRGVSPKTRVKFGLGYAPATWDALYKFLEEQGEDEATPVTAGLTMPNKNGGFRDRFVDRLMFPIINVQGKVVGFGGRVLDGGEPKYLNSSETPVFEKSRNLYGLNFAKATKRKDFLLVEGYMDVISLHQFGIDNAVAALGTAFNDDHARVLRRYNRQVVILFDSDGAGTNAALRAIQVLTKNGITTKVLQVRDAKDPDEFLQKFGADAFENLKRTASQSHVAFQVRQFLKKYDRAVPDEKIKLIEETAKILAALETSTEREVYAEEAAELTNIAKERFLRAAGSAPSAAETYKPKSGFEYIDQRNFQTQKKKGVTEAKKEIIKLAADNPGICAALTQYLKPEEMNDPAYEKLLRLVYEFARKKRGIHAAELLNYFEDVEEQSRAAAVFECGAEDASEKNINDILRRIKADIINERILHAQDAEEIQKLLEIKRKQDVLYITFPNG